MDTDDFYSLQLLFQNHRGLLSYYTCQFVHGGVFDGVEGAEVVEEFFLGEFADAREIVEFG